MSARVTTFANQPYRSLKIWCVSVIIYRVILNVSVLSNRFAIVTATSRRQTKLFSSETMPCQPAIEMSGNLTCFSCSLSYHVVLSNHFATLGGKVETIELFSLETMRTKLWLNIANAPSNTPNITRYDNTSKVDFRLSYQNSSTFTRLKIPPCCW